MRELRKSSTIRLHHQFFQFKYGKRMWYGLLKIIQFTIRNTQLNIVENYKRDTNKNILRSLKSNFLCYASLEVPEQCAKTLHSYALVTLFEWFKRAKTSQN